MDEDGRTDLAGVLGALWFDICISDFMKTHILGSWESSEMNGSPKKNSGEELKKMLSPGETGNGPIILLESEL